MSSLRFFLYGEGWIAIRVSPDLVEIHRLEDDGTIDPYIDGYFEHEYRSLRWCARMFAVQRIFGSQEQYTTISPLR